MRMFRPAAAPAPPPSPPPSTEGLETLVAGLFDYAGMFPPASLELDAALWESARSLRLRRPHIVGADLVVAADDLPRLDEERLRVAGFGDTEVRAAVVGVEAHRLDEAVVAVAERQAGMAGVLRIASIEAHGTTFDAGRLRAAAKALPGTRLYVEPRMPDGAWSRNAPGLRRLLQDLRPEGVGLKVRGHGDTAVGAATLGWLVPQAVALGVPLKATAGLHHPLVEARHGNALGFLGLAAAVRLRQALGDAFPPALVQECVAEADPAAFAFAGGLWWRGHGIDLARLQDAMRRQPFAIGSCSLKEPDEDLERLFGPPRQEAAAAPAEGPAWGAAEPVAFALAGGPAA